MPNKIVLGIAGRKASGKTAVANLLVQEYGAVRSSFGDPLKSMLRTLGLTQEQLWGTQKEVPDTILLNGKTPRHAMETLGTKWGREHIDPYIWARAWTRMTEIDRPNFTLVDDVRFDEEVEAIRSIGGLVLGIERGQVTFKQLMRERMKIAPASERFSPLVTRNKIPVLSNNGTLEQLVDEIMTRVRVFKNMQNPRVGEVI